MKYIASINIETGAEEDYSYIVTPNAQRVLGEMTGCIQTGIHSFSIIGTYGTGKSSFILALEKGLTTPERSLVPDKSIFFNCNKFTVLNIVGEYNSLSSILKKKLKIKGNDILEGINSICAREEKQSKAVLIVIDEFGKILEHAAKVNPEEELYFIQQLCEIVNDPKRHIILLTALHQNIGAYSSCLTPAQRNEWKKVKGRFKEIVFSEPVEQLLFLASEQIQVSSSPYDPARIRKIYDIARSCKLISAGCTSTTALKLNPLDAIAACCLTRAIQRYGQNERSLFSFLTAGGKYSLREYDRHQTCSYNLSDVYDYLNYNLYSEIAGLNADSTGWSALKLAIGRIESGILPDGQIEKALKIAKAIGLLNILAPPESAISRDAFISYAKLGLGIKDAEEIVGLLEHHKVIRYAVYKSQFILFEGTDINIEYELLKANTTVTVPSPSVEGLKEYSAPRAALASSYYYRTGTPRYFEFIICNTPEDRKPEGEIDGYCELVFPLDTGCTEVVRTISSETDQAIIFAVFNNMDEIIKLLHEINKLQYILSNIAVDDLVASKEIRKLIEYEKSCLNSTLNDNIFSNKGIVTWYFKGQPIEIRSRRDFNKMLSFVCETVYPSVPIVRNELFNKHKLSSAISLAKSNLLDAILEHSGEEDLGFEKESFPPEKAIYLSLLKNTGIYRKDSMGHYGYAEPVSSDFRELWKTCNEFIAGTSERPRKVSDLISILMRPPFKMKQGFIDFWIPVYLYLRQQDFALYGSNGNYVMNITKEVFELLWKHPGDFTIKAFSISGVKLDFFRKYRQFLNKQEDTSLSKDSFSETFKPFLVFYKRLNEYAKQTRKFNNPNVIKFREALAYAIDPEKVFFEVLPEALGYKGSALANDDEFIENYLEKIKTAVHELISCYSDLISRIEEKLIDELGLPDSFDSYKMVLVKRYGNIKKYLLPQKTKTFLERVLTPSDNKTDFIERISAVILDKPLSKLKDSEEELLIENMIYLFRELDRYAGLSTELDENRNELLYSLDILSSSGINETKRIYRIPKTREEAIRQLKAKISRELSGDDNLDICSLLELIAEKIH